MISTISLKRPTWSSALLLALLIAMNGMVLLNACLHNPSIGYDAGSHTKYMTTLAQGRLPTPADSNEFFSPPLAYVLPAICTGALGLSTFWALKMAQLFNVVLSVGICWFMLKLCELIRPGNAGLKLVSILCLAILPVYYKTFAFVRGEPFVLFLTVRIAYDAMRLYGGSNERPSHRLTALLGIELGLLALSRQWGFMLFPALIAWVGLRALKRPDFSRVVLSLATALTLSFAVGGWYYLHLWARYGSPTAFNHPPTTFSIRNQPLSFYLGTGTDHLFTAPVRPRFTNQFMPVFYSEIWGDYWNYFSVSGRDTRSGAQIFGPYLEERLAKKSGVALLETNWTTMTKYLGRVNAVSLFPTLLMTAGLMLGFWRLARLLLLRDPPPECGIAALSALAVSTTLLGFLWFLIKYPSDSGNTIKASYVIQIFPFIAILTAETVLLLRKNAPVLATTAVIVLVAVGLHNTGAMITSYPLFPR